MKEKYDFSGWATRNDIRCADGRTIRDGAFKANDGVTVPLVWQHRHDEPTNVLGHALLKYVPGQGMRAYGKFNESDLGRQAKLLVSNGDITSLSIYANQLSQNGGNVMHGNIREVSLVLAGANPGAYIDFPVLEHGETSEQEAEIYSGLSLYTDDASTTLEHADKEEEKAEETEDKAKEEEKQMPEKTVKDVFDSMTEEQKNVVYFMIGEALKQEGKGGDEDEEEVEHYDEGEAMKHNVFDNTYESNEDTLSHDAMMTIISDGKRYGSLKESFLQHAEDYGITNIEYLFPDAKTMENAPSFIKREDEWVKEVMNGTHHTPFSRVKSVFANITEDDARAKGYLKGHMKKNEFFSLIKRTTDPQTIYKKQKLDRDDVVDITDFDVVAWLKTEMRMMLNEELARAILIGDGRLDSSDDKIDEHHIRSIANDAALFTIKTPVDLSSKPGKALVTAVIRARKDYKGSGSPVMFTTENMLTEMLLEEDEMGRPLYKDVNELATKMRVRKIVTVPVMENAKDKANNTLLAIVVNLSDYNVGADKGGAINMFDDFDIDYNQQKYLIETRCSGALVKPYAAMSFYSGSGEYEDEEIDGWTPNTSGNGE